MRLVTIDDRYCRFLYVCELAMSDVRSHVGCISLLLPIIAQPKLFTWDGQRGQSVRQ